jgi:pimeloyl-ACP methyl ester carboxylesterase
MAIACRVRRTWLAATALTALLAITAGSARAAAPPGTKTVHARGITIAYKSIGAGRPLLLINGSGATLDTWDPVLLAALGAKRRIVIFDPRGMGATTDVAGDRLTVEEMADDAAGLLAALHIKRTDVLGWSLGGFVAQEVAIRHPARVRRLVLASSSPGGRNATEATPKVQAIDEKTTRGLAAPDEFLPILFPPQAQDAGNAWIARLLGQPGGCCEAFTPEAGGRQVAAQRRWYAASGGDEKRLGRIEAPTLIGAGALDRDVPAANARLLHRRIRGSKLKSYRDAGHAFLIQHASAFAAVVRKFLG